MKPLLTKQGATKPCDAKANILCCHLASDVEKSGYLTLQRQAVWRAVHIRTYVNGHRRFPVANADERSARLISYGCYREAGFSAQ